jgi:uncharacterized protein with PQ loop repeat
MADDVSYENILLIVANVINLVYNIPQMVRTYKTKSANDFDVWFLSLRVLYNFLWILYGIEVDSDLVSLNSIVTIFATLFVSYYKVLGYYKIKNTVVPVEQPVDETDMNKEISE